MLKIYARSRGGLAHGWGHVVRSLALTRALHTHCPAAEVLMAVEGDRAVSRFLEQQQDVQSRVFAEGRSGTAVEQRLLERFCPDVIAVDMLQVPEQLQRLYTGRCKRLAFFNDMGHAYSAGDIIVTPQLLHAYPQPCRGQRHLNGTDYFIVPDTVAAMLPKCRDRAAPAQVSSLLMVMGGCINRPVFEKLVLVIRQLQDMRFAIPFVLGYDHDIELQHYDELKAYGVRFVAGTDKLGLLMAEADMALASSGYVKYELAAVGTPAVLVSVVDHQDTLARAFVATGGCAEYAGDLLQAEPQAVARAVRRLAEDHERRQTLSAAGKKLVDGRAAERIVQELTTGLL